MSAVKRTLTENKKTPARYYDIAAAVFLAAFAVYYAAISAKGINAVDEAFYFTIPMRLLKGDGLLAEEWHVSQLSSVFQLLPYRIYTGITGSNDGVLMFFRYLFIACETAVAAFMYKYVRRYGVFGVFFLALFCAFVPVSIVTLNYYTMFTMSACAVSCMLFIKEKHTPLSLVFSGFLFACMVLIEPLMSFIWLIYCVLVAIKRSRAKKTGDEIPRLFSSRVWKLTFAGIAICAAAFFAWLLLTSDIKEIFKTIPEMFGDSEYAVGMGRGTIFNFGKIWDTVGYFGYVPPAAAVILFIVVFINRKSVYKKRAIFLITGTLILAAALIVFSIGQTFGNFAAAVMNYVLIPFYFYGLLCYILTREKNRKLFYFWCFGVLCAVFMDISSEISFGLGGVVAVLASVLIAHDLFYELRAEKEDNKAKNRKKKKMPEKRAAAAGVVSILTALCLAFASEAVLLSANFFVKNVENFFMHTEKKLDTEVSFGPYKGIKTTSDVNRFLELERKDLDFIKENTDGSCVYIAALQPWMYLYLDMPVGTYTTWFVQADYPARQMRYWELYPEKIPEYIYIPKLYCYTYTDLGHAGEDLAALKQFCDCDVTESEVGYIVKIVSMKL